MRSSPAEVRPSTLYYCTICQYFYLDFRQILKYPEECTVFHPMSCLNTSTYLFKGKRGSSKLRSNKFLHLTAVRSFVDRNMTEIEATPKYQIYERDSKGQKIVKVNSWLHGILLRQQINVIVPVSDGAFSLQDYSCIFQRNCHKFY